MLSVGLHGGLKPMMLGFGVRVNERNDVSGGEVENLCCSEEEILCIQMILLRQNS
jgi:hypothetical protein